MRNRKQIILITTALGFVGFAASVSHADPLPNEILKFQQLPLNNLVVGTPIYPGHDELSTAYSVVDANGVLQGWQGNFMADDFADKFSTPIVHISWWGSYLNNYVDGGIQHFLISIESDVPQIPGTVSFSHPGTPLLSQIVSIGGAAPTPGTFTEALVTASPSESLYKYNAELAVPFAEKPDTVYWLKIVALTDNPQLQWGWHDRNYTLVDPLASAPPLVLPGEADLGPFAGGPVWHFQDDAVSGRLTIGAPLTSGNITVIQDPQTYQPQNYIDFVDGPQGIGNYSKDLAFELYTVVPEPTSIGLLSMTALTALTRRRK